MKRVNRKIIEYIIPLIFVITLNFFIPRLMPGDPFTMISDDSSGVSFTYSEEEMDKYKAYYGLDKPLYKQFFNYIKKLFKGYLGYSIYYNENVLDIIIKRIKWTITLVIVATIISSSLGTIFGALSAYYKNSLLDKTLYTFFITFSQIPSFLIGLIFLFYFSAYLKFFPLAGGITAFSEFNSWFDKFIDLIYHGFLPALTLSIVNMGSFYLLSRNSMLSVLTKDYIVTAKAKALKKRVIIFKHTLKNAILPIVTRIFLNFGTLIGGAVLVENVFKYPGLGTLIREAVYVRDYPLIQGIFLFIALLVFSMNLLSDLVYKKLDPRL
ncbi:MAG: ABC transporter permease [Firmicutes bacterium]|nr:ABC transporter permease [Bacillota bacterium]